MRRYAASRGGSAGQPNQRGTVVAAQPVTRRAVSACAQAMADVRACAAPVSGAGHRRPDFPPNRAASQAILEIVRSCTPLVSRCRWNGSLPRRKRQSLGRALARRWQAAETAHPRGDPADRVRRRGPEQVPRQNRLRLAKPDGLTVILARPRRGLSANSSPWTRCGAVGPEPAETAQDRHRAPGRGARRRSGFAAARSRQSG